MLIDQAKSVIGIWDKYKWGQQKEATQAQKTAAHHNHTTQQTQGGVHANVAREGGCIFSTPEEKQQESYHLLNQKS